MYVNIYKSKEKRNLIGERKDVCLYLIIKRDIQHQNDDNNNNYNDATKNLLHTYE